MIFELDNVELSFNGKQILYGLYIKAETGRITGILGSNGCGKTSLLRIFFGNLSCNNKLVRINNKGTLKKLYSIENVKFLSQTNFLPNISLKKLFNIYRVSLEEFTEKLPSFRIYKNFKLNELSGGEKRMVSIWLTIKSDAKLVLLDEPFTHLTPVYTEIIKEELINEKKNKAILLTDHLYKDIMEISDELYFIKDGCSRAVSTTDELEKLGYVTTP
ncbi:ATP-binding cassette domain-containing protein [Gramella jeungdoensis]|uniref:ATP-binding cassette domain-containing protein n=1 Tax=Gramella jeungdoensis TaxID=708091 RepID=A0ABT0Z0M7_9FLAO|nr:ATP-binding cassette domain-containing protein [Gramella jeungdoensis]MCM8569124.1 ATP-binding cassette domain-containing protein [Gramella jeungdoensis]